MKYKKGFNIEMSITQKWGKNMNSVYSAETIQIN